MDKKFNKIYLDGLMRLRDTSEYMVIQGTKFAFKRITAGMSFQIMTEAVQFFGLTGNENLTFDHCLDLSIVRNCLFDYKSGDLVIDKRLEALHSGGDKYMSRIDSMAKTAGLSIIKHEFNLSFELMSYEKKEARESAKGDFITREEEVERIENNIMITHSLFKVFEIENKVCYSDKLFIRYAIDNTSLRVNGGLTLASRMASALEPLMAHDSMTLDRLLYSVNNFMNRKKASGLAKIKYSDYTAKTLSNLISQTTKTPNKSGDFTTDPDFIYYVRIVERIKTKDYGKFICQLPHIDGNQFGYMFDSAIITPDDLIKLKDSNPKGFQNLIEKLEQPIFAKIKECGII